MEIVNRNFAQYLLATVVILLSLVRNVRNDGIISVKFIRYENKDGTGDNGHCCDGRWGICEQNGCDHRFTVCLDRIDSGDDMRNCEYGMMVTYDVKNRNIIEFGEDIRGTPNPISFRIARSMPMLFALKIDVMDQDQMSKDDHVDFFRKNINTTSNAMDADYVLEERTWLNIQLKTRCIKDFYGRSCETYCAKPTSIDHYKCDVITGEKICQQGWTSPNCSIAPCNNYECNGGKCDVTAHGHPLCICTEDFTGSHCETHKCKIICQPGTCKLVNNQTIKFICHCEDHKGNNITGIEEPCQFPVIEKTTESPPTTPAPFWNNDCNTIIRHPIHGPGSRGRNDIYTIHPPGGPEFLAYCQMSSSAEGWTVIQRRQSGAENFYRGWEDYKNGFGKNNKEGDGEFWLGLEKMHRLTSNKRYKLRVDIVDYFGDIKYADYEYFFIDGEKQHYMLHVSGHSGDAGDSLSRTDDDNNTLRHHDGMPFSTYDHDLDASKKYNCAQLFQSGWWFSSCLRSNLNGVYRQPTGDARCCAYKDRCVTWQTIDRMSLKRVEMKIIPNER